MTSTIARNCYFVVARYFEVIMKIPYTDEQEMLDITQPEEVEVLVRADRKVLWVNVDGQCKLRICRIKNLTIIEESKRNGTS